MEWRNYDTGPLWRDVMSLLVTILVLLILIFTYLLLEDTIQEYLDRPSFTKEQLEEFSKKREIRIRKERAENWDLVENGIHVKTGLRNDPNLQLIIGSCTSCHSAKLITQNRATRQGWKSMIDWMQETQGLQDLGSREPIILDYLAKHYAPKKSGRRANINVEEIEWYILNLD